MIAIFGVIRRLAPMTDEEAIWRARQTLGVMWERGEAFEVEQIADQDIAGNFPLTMVAAIQVERMRGFHKKGGGVEITIDWP